MSLTEILLKEGKISKISEMEVSRYVNFFEKSYQDNLDHCRFNIGGFPRWSIISGYYAMHDMTKLYLAKKYRIKIEEDVHSTTIKVLAEILVNEEIMNLIRLGYREFLSMAQDLQEARKERVKAQYFTGTEFSKEVFRKRAIEFEQDIVIPYLEKMKKLMQQK